FSYTVTDNHGVTATQTATVTVSITDTGPTLVADTASTNEDATIIINMLANDSAEDSGDTLTLTAVQATTAKGAAVTIVSGQASYNPTSSTAFETLSLHDALPISFSYTVTDNHGVTATQTATVTVSITDTGPTLVADTASTNEDAAISINVLSNDHAEDSGDSLTLTAVQGTTAKGAAVTIVSGQASYNPTSSTAFETLANGASTTDTFSYTVTDNHG